MRTFKLIYPFTKLFGFNFTFMRFQPEARSVELDPVQRKGMSPIAKAKHLNRRNEGMPVPIAQYYHKPTACWMSLSMSPLSPLAPEKEIVFDNCGSVGKPLLHPPR